MEAVEEYGGCGRKVVGWAARDTSGVLSPYSFTLRKTGDEDVVFKVLYCGVDHTDLHQMRSELYGMNYPLVPGHEIVGEVMKLGSDVKKFKVGDIVGVGCIVGSCGNCSRCNSNLEQYCRDRVLTYGGVYKDGTSTQGGFSTAMVVHQRFVVAIPESLSPEQAAPLLCGGVTAYSPLRQFCGLKSGLKGGILGLGGVGHIAVKVAKAMGHHVTVISSSERKRFEAMSHLGADDFLVSSDPTQIAQAGDSLDYILDTVPGAHPLDLYLPLLNFDGKLLMVGASPQALQFQATNVILGMRSYLGHGDAITFMGRTQGRRTITGSFVGSIEETQELLNLWAEKGLSCMIEVVKMDYIHTAMERMERGDVRYRFVLDVAGSNLE